MESLAPLIWIEADRKPAKYFLNSLNIHNELFPSAKKVVITNYKYFELYKDSKVELIAIESLGTDKYLRKFESIDKKWSTTQNQLDYWTNTTKRFFYLFLYLTTAKSSTGIHLESDCILINSRDIESILQLKKRAIYYPRVNPSLGCAEVFVVNGLASLEKFLEFININWSGIDKTDMNLLGEFLNVSRDAQALPSNSTKNLESEYLYDSGLIAKYFIGSDARNHRFPFSKRGILNSYESAFNPSFYKILLEKSTSLYLKNILTNRQYTLTTIHFHDKRIPRKLRLTLDRVVRDSNRKRNNLWRLGRLDYNVIFERFINKMNQIVLRNPSELRLR